jgi:hypothetical protein
LLGEEALFKNASYDGNNPDIKSGRETTELTNKELAGSKVN